MSVFALFVNARAAALRSEVRLAVALPFHWYYRNHNLGSCMKLPVLGFQAWITLLGICRSVHLIALIESELV